MKTGITIVTYERSIELLRLVLGRIFQHSGEIEVVLVSNSEHEDAKRVEESLQKEFPFTLLRGRSLFVLTARNRGTMHQLDSCDYFVEMDDDVIVAPEWLERIIHIMETDKTIGIAVPLMNFHQTIWYKDQVVNLPSQVVNNVRAIVKGNYDTTLMDSFWQEVFAQKKPRHTEITVPEITIQVKSKKAVEAGCLWDEGLDGACVAANSALGHRVRDAGMKVVSVKHSFVYHLQTSTHARVINRTNVGGHLHTLNRQHIQKEYGGFEKLYAFESKNKQLYSAPKENILIYQQHAEANLRS